MLLNTQGEVMKKSLVALSIAAMSTAALAQSNVTIYGVADVSAQGTSLSKHVGETSNPSGTSFNLKSNDSFIGFKGTEALGNGNKALFQVESYVNMTGGQAVAANNGNLFGTMRDSYVGFGSKYGTVLGGYLSTPYRTTVTSFDVFPGDRSDAVIENVIGKQRFGGRLVGANATGYVQADSTVRATALAYAIPTFYGVDASIAYTGSNNNGGSNQTNNTISSTGQTTLAPQNALSFNLGWTGYGFGVKGAFSQAKVNATVSDDLLDGSGPVVATTPFNGYTSYLVGVQYTGVPGLKTGVLYNRNSLGTNASGNLGAQKGSNNQVWVGASYRFGNNEPRVSYVSSSDTSGINGIGQDGGTQWNLGWGYYLSKRTQVYGLVTQYKNNANGVWSPIQTSSNMLPTGGQTYTTYGAGLRTNF
jgi:predicted porin